MSLRTYLKKLRHRWLSIIVNPLSIHISVNLSTACWFKISNRILNRFHYLIESMLFKIRSTVRRASLNSDTI
ncbi:hypothetical protein C480_10150 [Natrialba aegyptia DSM 13077]|uniref:Uncharacterized protein n=1 Tax=Natrialba aegyptia DSM 13077 TaxID=1227491 RepID=M0B4B2_9EURY|nr:hypothetical protein C480_10150 [Natrialba aegyptia DSM 13077]